MAEQQKPVKGGKLAEAQGKGGKPAGKALEKQAKAEAAPRAATPRPKLTTSRA